MTRMRIEDLPPRMRKQALKQIAEQEKNKKESIVFEEPPVCAEKQSGSNKYRATKKTVTLSDGTEHTFDSAKEARIYDDLLMRLKAKEISNLRLQVPYELIPKQKLTSGKTERSVKYIADFVYEENDVTKVVDVKGYRKGTAYAVFVIKRKLMKWVLGIEVTEM